MDVADYLPTPPKSPLSEIISKENIGNNFQQKTPSKRLLLKENKTTKRMVFEKEETIAQITEKYEILEEEYNVQVQNYENLLKQHLELQKKFESATLGIRKLYGENKYLKTQIVDMHEQIQDLKGNIRVFCRLKPTIEKEKGYKVQLDKGTKGTSSVKIIIPQKSNVGKEKQTLKTHEFSFDHVFDGKTTQEEIFKEMEPLIESCIDGFNVCVFAYGQTGSGKTFTMQGEEKENRGIIPRSLELIFDIKKKNIDWEYKFEVEFYEIYNENIRDLQNKKKNEKVQLKDVLKVEVDDVEKILQLLNDSLKNRAVESTDSNDKSSRSHSIFTLRIFGNHKFSEKKTEGTLNLIDLAGSERVKDSNATGLRMKEAQKINSSLSVLGQVMTSLRSKQEHVPFRDSTLTTILKPSLEGKKSKILMVVNVQEDCLSESINSLTFASTVNSCKLK
jgi:kinesin family member C1